MQHRSETSHDEPVPSTGTSPDEPRSGPLPRGIVILIGLAAATITIAGARAAAGIIAPVFLALVIAVAAEPIRTRIALRGWPRWVGTLLALAAVYVGLLVLAVSLVVAAARFATLLPDYQKEFADLLDNARSVIVDLGVAAPQVDALVDAFDVGQLVDVLTAFLSGILSLLTSLAFIVTLILFMCLDASAFRRHLEGLHENRPGFVDAIGSFAQGTRKYLLVSTAFGLLVAVIDTGLLLLLGVPGAVLWGLLAFITNYIPNIGFVLGLVPPVILGLLEGGPQLMILVIISYSVVNVIIQSVIQPKLVGDAVGISASITFLSLVVWAWILGPLGAVLAVPLTLLVKALIIDADPSARWVGGLIGDHRERA